MSTQRSTLVAIFRDRAMAEQAIERLQEKGFQNDRLYYSGGDTRAGVLSIHDQVQVSNRRMLKGRSKKQVASNLSSSPTHRAIAKNR